MNDVIIMDNYLPFSEWQVGAALNTQLGKWPPVPMEPDRPYLYLYHFPIFGLTIPNNLTARKETAPAILYTLKAPEIGTVIPAREALKPKDGIVSYAYDDTPVTIKGEGLDWRSLFANLPMIEGPGAPAWSSRLFFKIISQDIRLLNDLEDNEALAAGVVSLYAFRKGNGQALITKALTELYGRLKPETAFICFKLQRVEGRPA